MRVLVTGAGGLVGRPLADRCDRLGLDTRRSGRHGGGQGWLAWDMATTRLPAESGFDCILHAAPLWLLPDHLADLADAGVARVVCYGSTSASTKKASRSDADRRLAESLNRAEDRIRTESRRLGVAATILRPTMIYGYGRDRNVNAIAGFIRRYGFFAVAGSAEGKRQPVHADDLVDAAAAVLECTAAHGKAYDLPGGETLTYRTMVERIFEGLGRRARIIRVPVGLYSAFLGLAGLFNAGVTGSMAERMSQDMVFDAREARMDFGFAPGGFLTRPDRDLWAA